MPLDSRAKTSDSNSGTIRERDIYCNGVSDHAISQYFERRSRLFLVMHTSKVRLLSICAVRSVCYETVGRPSVCLSHRSTAAATCGRFALRGQDIAGADAQQQRRRSTAHSTICELTRRNTDFVNRVLMSPILTHPVTLPPSAPSTHHSHHPSSLLAPSITPSLFYSRLKTFLFCKSFPP